MFGSINFSSMIVYCYVHLLEWLLVEYQLKRSDTVDQLAVHNWIFHMDVDDRLNIPKRTSYLVIRNEMILPYRYNSLGPKKKQD